MLEVLGYDIVNLSAVALHDALVHFAVNAQPNEWIVVKIAGDNQQESTFYIRPDLGRCDDKTYVMADDVELIPCITNSGEKIDIIMPPIIWKQDRPAKLRPGAPSVENNQS